MQKIDSYKAQSLKRKQGEDAANQQARKPQKMNFNPAYITMGFANWASGFGVSSLELVHALRTLGRPPMRSDVDTALGHVRTCHLLLECT